MKLFRLALAATGIGLLVIALGVLIANFDKIKNAVQNNTEEFKKFKEGLMIMLPVIGLIVKGIEYLVRNFDKIKQVASGVASAISESFQKIGQVISGIVSGDYSKVKEAFKNLGTDLGKSYNEGLQKEIENQRNKMALLMITTETDINKKRIALLKAMGKNVEALELQQLGKEAEMAQRRLNENEKINTRIYLEALTSGEKLTEAEAKRLEKLTDNEKAYIDAVLAFKMASYERDRAITEKANKKAEEDRKKREEDRKKEVESLINSANQRGSLLTLTPNIELKGLNEQIWSS